MAGYGNTEDEASLEFLAAKRDIPGVVGVVAEVSAASVDGRRRHAATAGPARNLKRLVPATMSPLFGFVGQQKHRSPPHLEVSAAVVA